jgi:hypothetical protein
MCSPFDRSATRWTTEQPPRQSGEPACGHLLKSQQAISSSGYRYPRTIVPTKIPQNIGANCIRLANELGLAFAGIDLKETPAGEYYCFEVNASPAFPFYESPARPIVADALARFLAEASA